MDFVFASFPWIITYNMDLKRREKIGLCLTMSLGMVVAIESTIRNEWKYGGNDKDRWYFWRLAMSNIWYNSEVSGTIIVQCVPVLRPVVQDICISLRSKRLGSSHDGIALEDVQFYHARGHVGWDVNGS